VRAVLGVVKNDWTPFSGSNRPADPGILPEPSLRASPLAIAHTGAGARPSASVWRLAPVLSGLDQGPQAHAGLQLLCTSSGAPLALEPRPRRAIASPLRLRIARGGDAGAGPSVELRWFKFPMTGTWRLATTAPPKPRDTPGGTPRPSYTYPRTARGSDG
jgi:hypothetical protein